MEFGIAFKGEIDPKQTVAIARHMCFASPNKGVCSYR